MNVLKWDRASDNLIKINQSHWWSDSVQNTSTDNALFMCLTVFCSGFSCSHQSISCLWQLVLYLPDTERIVTSFELVHLGLFNVWFIQNGKMDRCCLKKAKQSKANQNKPSFNFPLNQAWWSKSMYFYSVTTANSYLSY